MARIPENLKKTIAENIRDCRKTKYPGRGGAKLCASEFGVSPQQWSPWERGMRTPDDDHMQRIADFFGVSVDYLRENHSRVLQRPEGHMVIPPGGTKARMPESASFEYHSAQGHLFGLDYFALAKWFYNCVFRGGLTETDIQEISEDAFKRFLSNHLNLPHKDDT